MPATIAPISAYSRPSVLPRLKRFGQAIRNYMLDVRPGDSPCFVAGMGMGGEIKSSGSVCDNQIIKLFASLHSETLKTIGELSDLKYAKEEIPAIRKASGPLGQAKSTPEALKIMREINELCEKILNNFVRRARQRNVWTDGFDLGTLNPTLHDAIEYYFTSCYKQAKALVQQGKEDQAIALVEKIKTDDEILHLLFEAINRIPILQKNPILEAAQRHKIYGEKDYILYELSDELLYLGKVDKALETARKMCLPYNKSLTLKTFAELLAREKKCNEAKEIIVEAFESAKKVEDPVERLRALISVAETLTAIEPQVSSCQLEI